jgi:hypothetical protein
VANFERREGVNLRDLRKKLIFAAGDIRREHCPFGFAWGKYEHLIDYNEATIAGWMGKTGYIGLHRNRGDLSNMAISGFMKHAFLFDGMNNTIIEAVSEGVVCRHPFHALLSDYAVILKPLVCEKVMIEAVERAKSMVGCPYDDRFRFDLEIVDELFQDKETALANMRQYGLGVSCTELAALCYVGHRRELGLYRTKLGKREVILPDAYLSTHFEIVWASKHTTPENACLLGLHEEGIEQLRTYWEGVSRR